MKQIFGFAIALCFVLLGVLFVLHYPLSVSLLDIDFNLRFNETCSVLNGVDPFLIWNGTVASEAYVPWSFAALPYYQILPMVHAYPPWAYAIISPFALFDQTTAAGLFRCVQLVCLTAVFAFVLLRLRRLTGNWILPCVGFASLCLAASDGFTRCLIVGNFGIVSTAAAFGALWMHERGRDEVAALCWFFVLLKPQLGGLFLITLLLEWKWRTLLMLAFSLAVVTLCVSWQCGRNPMSMILCVGECGLRQFPGTGLVNVALYRAGTSLIGERLVLASSALVGIAGCVGSWWLVRRHPSVWVRFLPAAVLSVVWSTWREHDFSIHLLVAYALVTLMWRERGFCLSVLLVLLATVSMRSPMIIGGVTWLVCCNYVSFLLLVLACVVIRFGLAKSARMDVVTDCASHGAA